jgi:hypothetical protein
MKYGLSLRRNFLRELFFPFMYQKIRLFFVMLVVLSAPAFAQDQNNTALVKGRLTNQANAPVSDVQVTIPFLRLLTNTDGQGAFSFSRVPYGTHTLVIGGLNVLSDSIRIVVNSDVVDLGNIGVTPNDAATSQQSVQIPAIALEELNEGDDEGNAGQNVSGLLTAARDPFQNTIAYVFGPYRFQPRGYDRNQQQVLINGAPMNDVETGDAFWSQWGGLNDVIRSRVTTYGLQPSEYAFGGVNGTVFFDATAAHQRKQTRITYSLTNRQYRNRLMLTHSTGMLANGWAFSASLSRRWAKEGYVDGTFYDGYSYYLAASKKLGSKHMLSLTAFGAPTRRGLAAPTFQEAYDLAGSNFYNPNWGYQNGEKRNARIANNHQPVFLLSHEYNPSNSVRWQTTVGYQFGKVKSSRLDWYNAPDPRPDYYRYLPSFYMLDDPQNPPNPEAAEATRRAFQANPQINWSELYNANYLNRQPKPNPDGTLTTDSGSRSLYVIGSDVDDIKKWTFNTNLQKVVNEHITIATGITFINQKTESYRELDDLLGGDYFINVNSFTERNFTGQNQFSQNDQNNPNQILKKGDKYLYNYIMRFTKAWWWGQATFTYNKVDFFVAANYGFNSFQREGLYRNGLFAAGNESFGKGDKQNFSTYGLKGGITYKLNGRNYIFVNAGLFADAPTVDNTHFSARYRNAYVENPTTQKMYSLEGGYLLRAPKLNGRLVGYVTDRKDGVEVQRFFYEGAGGSNSMVAYVMQNVNSRFIGLELALEYKMSPSLSATGVASLGQAFYTSNPDVTIHNENFVDSLPLKEKTYLNNYYLGVGPQSIYSLGFNYRSKKYWYVNLNFNYLDRNYVDPAAGRRTAQAVELLEPGSQQWHDVLDQEKFPSAFTVDLFAGKSFLLSKSMKFLPRNTFLYVNVGVSNLLDNKSVPTNGFENARFDYEGRSADRFAPKLYYAFGRNYFINLALKF